MITNFLPYLFQVTLIHTRIYNPYCFYPMGVYTFIIVHNHLHLIFQSYHSHAFFHSS